ncbi:MAG: hypothetical protein QF814_08470 [Candidatus Marinimicrobia bacterium]|jgi:hypothetical protein|nr:hypothetical protein [Candidatus Neomarinimicrobiota bacterium]|tara:strand:- start:1777 stop:2136 length:360 start_codon:yes stop_codon:yes gene_type:complete
MLKRAISIGLSTLMTLAIAAPLVHFVCEMAYCEVQKESCCDSKIENMDNCSMTMATCDHSQFVPIISGPKSDQKFMHDINLKSTALVILEIAKCKQPTNTTFLHLPPDPPAKFITPLLI